MRGVATLLATLLVGASTVLAAPPPPPKQQPPPPEPSFDWKEIDHKDLFCDKPGSKEELDNYCKNEVCTAAVANNPKYKEQAVWRCNPGHSVIQPEPGQGYCHIPQQKKFLPHFPQKCQCLYNITPCEIEDPCGFRVYWCLDWLFENANPKSWD